MGRREDREALRASWVVNEPRVPGVPIWRKDIEDAMELAATGDIPRRLAQLVDPGPSELHSYVPAAKLAAELELPYRGDDLPIYGVSSLRNPRPHTLMFATGEVPSGLPDGVIVISSQARDGISSDRPRLDFVRALYVLDKHGRFGDRQQPWIHPTAIIKRGAVIGEDGYGFERDRTGMPIRMMHLGGINIGPHAEIGSCTTVCRGTLDNTIIEAYAKIDDRVHIAHNVHVGRGAMVVAGATLCGSVKVGAGAYVGVNACVREGITIGECAFVGMGAVVIRDVPAGVTVIGNPAYVMDRK